MPRGRIKAIAVGVRSAMAVDWIALTTGIFGAGIAVIALLIILERDNSSDQTLPRCEDVIGTTVNGDADAPCSE